MLTTVLCHSSQNQGFLKLFKPNMSDDMLIDFNLPEAMLAEVISVVVGAISQKNWTELDVSRHCMKCLQDKFGGKWICVTGMDFASDFNYQHQRFAMFKGPNYAVLVFQLPEGKLNEIK